MPLPEKVIEQLGRETTETQGWAASALFFSGGILFLALAVYFGLTFGYTPYLQSQLNTTRDQVNALENSISTGDQTQLIDFYSQIANLQSLLNAHVHTSQMLTWFEKNTEANVYYQSLSLTTGEHISLAGVAASEADINQQMAIFENSPDVSSVSISNVTAPQLAGSGWDFNVILVMNPSVFTIASPQ
jgi:Tfp pilus assembly protein PilN